MAGNILAGPAVTAHNNARLTTARFTDLEVNTAPSLRVLERLADGQIRLEIIGQLGVRYSVETSSNLVHWTNLGILVNTNVTSGLLDTQAAVFNQRFYRGILAR